MEKAMKATITRPPTVAPTTRIVFVLDLEEEEEEEARAVEVAVEVLDARDAREEVCVVTGMTDGGTLLAEGVELVTPTRAAFPSVVVGCAVVLGAFTLAMLVVLGTLVDVVGVSTTTELVCAGGVELVVGTGGIVCTTV
jgi:hypothetical protein